MLEIQLFGTTLATPDGETVASADFGGTKPRQILEILALADGAPVPKDRLAELVWAGAPPASYVGTLESYICLLRRRLNCARGRAAAITTTTHGYQLDTRQVRVDLVECRTLLARAAKAGPAEAVRLTRAAVDMARKPLLASEAYGEWADRERNAFHHELVEACVRAAAHALDAEQADQALVLARTAAELDRFSEPAARQLMRAMRGCGRRGEALRVFLDLRRDMIEELGVEPGQATHDLYLELLRDEPGPVAAQRREPEELRTLLGLLRQALEALPGVEPTKGDSGLSYVAVKVLSVA
jgi:DNA-binding SARP family transcriptional activator